MTDQIEETGINRNDSNEDEIDKSGCNFIDVCETTPAIATAEIGLQQASRFAWFKLDETAVPLLQTLPSDSQRCYRKMNAMPGPERIDLGHFRLDEHHEVSFEAVPALNYVGCNEFGAIPPNSNRDVEQIRKRISPTERFLQVTDKNIPVPRMLIELDDDSDDETVQRMLRKRDVETHVQNASNLPANNDVTAEPPVSGDSVAVCFNGGHASFANAYCGNTGVNYCDNGAWHQLTRSSGSARRRKSHSRTSSCHGTSVVFHFYRGWFFGWKWFYVRYALQSNQQFVPHGWYKYWVHTGGARRRRKVERYGPGSGGYFRAWTGFYN